MPRHVTLRARHASVAHGVTTRYRWATPRSRLDRVLDTCIFGVLAPPAALTRMSLVSRATDPATRTDCSDRAQAATKRHGADRQIWRVKGVARHRVAQHGKRPRPALWGRASAGRKRALWDGVSFVSTRLAPSDLVGHGEGVDRPRCADLGRLGVAVARARCDGLGRRHPGVRFRGSCGGCLVFRQGPSTSR